MIAPVCYWLLSGVFCTLTEGLTPWPVWVLNRLTSLLLSVLTILPFLAQQATIIERTLCSLLLNGLCIKHKFSLLSDTGVRKYNFKWLAFARLDNGVG